MYLVSIAVKMITVVNEVVEPNSLYKKVILIHNLTCSVCFVSIRLPMLMGISLTQPRLTSGNRGMSMPEQLSTRH